MQLTNAGPQTRQVQNEDPEAHLIIPDSNLAYSYQSTDCDIILIDLVSNLHFEIEYFCKSPLAHAMTVTVLLIFYIDTMTNTKHRG